MPVPAPIEVFQLEPHQAQAYAEPLQGFLEHIFLDAYVQRLGLRMNILADPTDTAPGGKVAQQAERIATSTSLSQPDTAAYIVARDPSRTHYNGLVGIAKLSRTDATTVCIEEVDVARDRRREGIALTMLEEALGRLAVGPNDRLMLDVLVHNRAARLFWEGVGFAYTGARQHHGDVFPDVQDYHLEMIAPEPLVYSTVRQRLHGSP